MHWFLDPITKHYADFNGRASRQEYWMFALVSIPVMFVVFLISGVLGATLGSSAGLGVILILVIGLGLGLFIPSIALAVRRLHDTGRSGWWLLLSFIPYIGSIILLVFYCLKSEDGNNSYGPNPYGVQAMSAPVMTPTQPVATAAIAEPISTEVPPVAQATEAPVVGYSNVTKEQ